MAQTVSGDLAGRVYTDLRRHSRKEVNGMDQTQEAPAATLKKIVVRKAGTVRLTAMCSNYCYGCCSCLRAL